MFGKERGYRLGNQGLDFADDDLLDARMHHKGPGRDARAAADNEHGARLGVEQGRDVPEHPLQLHVLRFA